jgi:hypothetical protein
MLAGEKGGGERCAQSGGALLIAGMFRGLAAASLALVLSLTVTASAQVGGDNQTVDNVLIYLGLMPAEMIRGHPAEHTESSMHGGPAAASDDYHILIALFDAQSGERISGAKVEARVSEVGYEGPEKTLEPMEIAGTETYGNFFPMAGHGPFRIEVAIRLPGQSREIRAHFEHRHP